MQGDRERWDGKYHGAWGERFEAPHPFVAGALDDMEELDGVTPGRALDLACGTGRHALFLAARGWRCTGWDVSPAGLALLEAHAAARGFSIATHALDLVPFTPPGRGEPFDLVLVSDFFDRALWAELHRLVVPGGHALALGFTQAWTGTRPPREYRLEEGELMAGLAGFTTVLYDEGGGRVGWLGRRDGGHA